jgi:hypothetical protein
MGPFLSTFGLMLRHFGLALEAEARCSGTLSKWSNCRKQMLSSQEQVRHCCKYVDMAEFVSQTAQAVLVRAELLLRPPAGFERSLGKDAQPWSGCEVWPSRSVAARKVDAPAAVQAAIVNVAELSSISGGG